jgi:hypothetical protein
VQGNIKQNQLLFLKKSTHQKSAALLANTFAVELLQRAYSPQVLPDGSASRAAGSFNSDPVTMNQ